MVLKVKREIQTHTHKKLKSWRSKQNERLKLVR